MGVISCTLRLDDIAITIVKQSEYQENNFCYYWHYNHEVVDLIYKLINNRLIVLVLEGPSFALLSPHENPFFKNIRNNRAL